MTQYFILTKNKNSKAWTRAIPVKPGTSLKDVRLNLKKKPSKHKKRIVTKTWLLNFLRKNTSKKRILNRM